jgi:hypothetical protein
MSIYETPSASDGLNGTPQSSVQSVDIVPASMTGRVMVRDEKMESRRRLVEARTLLFRTERDYMAEAGSENREVDRQVRAIKARVADLAAEARAIEVEAQMRVRVLLKQAELERKLGERIRAIADRNALAVLDRIKEASDSMMNWAEETATDLGMMMKEEAAGQVARKVNDINAVRDAMEDEERAAELLALAGKLQSRAA